MAQWRQLQHMSFDLLTTEMVFIAVQFIAFAYLPCFGTRPSAHILAQRGAAVPSARHHHSTFFRESSELAYANNSSRTRWPKTVGRKPYGILLTRRRELKKVL